MVTGDEIAEAVGGLIDDVDRGSLTGDFAEAVATSTREGLRNSYWGWFDDDMAFSRDWGFDIAPFACPCTSGRERTTGWCPSSTGSG